MESNFARPDTVRIDRVEWSKYTSSISGGVLDKTKSKRSMKRICINFIRMRLHVSET